MPPRSHFCTRLPLLYPSSTSTPISPSITHSTIPTHFNHPPTIIDTSQPQHSHQPTPPSPIPAVPSLVHDNYNYSTPSRNTAEAVGPSACPTEPSDINTHHGLVCHQGNPGSHRLQLRPLQVFRHLPSAKPWPSFTTMTDLSPAAPRSTLLLDFPLPSPLSTTSKLSSRPPPLMVESSSARER